MSTGEVNADMVELVDTSDLKSEGDYLRPGSSPGVRTNKNYYSFKSSR